MQYNMSYCYIVQNNNLKYGPAWRAAAGVQPAPPSLRGAAAAELSSAVPPGGAAGAVAGCAIEQLQSMLRRRLQRGGGCKRRGAVAKDSFAARLCQQRHGAALSSSANA